jgi:hypothetical protein
MVVPSSDKRTPIGLFRIGGAQKIPGPVQNIIGCRSMRPSGPAISFDKSNTNRQNSSKPDVAFFQRPIVTEKKAPNTFTIALVQKCTKLENRSSSPATTQILRYAYREQSQVIERIAVNGVPIKCRRIQPKLGQVNLILNCCRSLTIGFP